MSSRCALLSDNSVWCWGLAADTSPNTSPADDYVTSRPQQIVLPLLFATGPANRGPALTPPTAIAANSGGACALFSNGSVWCWTLGVRPGDIGPSYTKATLVTGLATATSIAAGGNTVCATVQDGTVWCWTAGQAPTQEVNPSDGGAPEPYHVDQADAGASEPRLAVGINIASLQYCDPDACSGNSRQLCVAVSAMPSSPPATRSECWMGESSAPA